MRHTITRLILIGGNTMPIICNVPKNILNFHLLLKKTMLLYYGFTISQIFLSRYYTYTGTFDATIPKTLVLWQKIKNSGRLILSQEIIVDFVFNEVCWFLHDNYIVMFKIRKLYKNIFACWFNLHVIFIRVFMWWGLGEEMCRNESP